VNFKGQEIKRTEYPFNVLTGDKNEDEELRPDNKYYLSGRTLAVSCRGCEAIREPVCYGKRQTPTPPIPAVPTPPDCSARDRRSIYDGSSEERGPYGRRPYEHRYEKPECQRCGQCTAGVELYRFGDPEFAIDGGVLSAEVRPSTSNNTCRGCRGRYNEDRDEDIIERNSTLEQRCFSDGGSTFGSDFYGQSFFYICEKPQDMCVCALRRDGRLEGDKEGYGHRERACYGVTANATWGGAAASIATKCRRPGQCENFFVAANNLEVSNGVRTFRGDNNTVEFSFEDDHYLHAPRLAVGCRGCEELEKRLSCRGRNSRRGSSEE